MLQATASGIRHLMFLCVSPLRIFERTRTKRTGAQTGIQPPEGREPQTLQLSTGEKMEPRKFKELHPAPGQLGKCSY